MGYDTSFAHILPINYCQQQDLYIKKLSYLLAAMLVKPGDELQLLMNNTIMKDLQSENIFVTMIALTMIRYFAVADNIESFMPLVIKLTKSKTSVLRKKSLLVLYNFHSVDSKYVVNIKNLALEALGDSDTSVVFTGSFILKMLVLANPHAHKDIVKQICEVLMKIVDHKYPH
jgi:AP-4 complex subunit epsilon-1